MIIVILASTFASGIRAEPVDALGTMTKVDVGLPGGLVNGYILSLWGSSDSVAYAVGYGSTATSAERPLFYAKNVSGWAASSPALPVAGVGGAPRTFTSGRLEAVWSSGTIIHAVGYGTSESINRPLLYSSTNGGANWTAFDPDLPGTSNGQLFGVWGFASDNVYAVGSGTSGAVPLLYKFNGSTWTAETISLPVSWNYSVLADVWGSGPDDIYAVGKGNAGGSELPLILHYDGTGWSDPILPELPPGWIVGSVNAVWGSGFNDVYMVGSGNTGTSATLPLILHYENGVWNSSSPVMPSGWTTAYLSSVWGNIVSGEIYLAGTGQGSAPLLYREAGSNHWAASYSVTGWASGSFNDIWGFGSKNLYGVGTGAGDQPLLAHAVGDDVAPGAVTDLTASPGASTGSVNLSWFAPADDAGEGKEYTGPVDRYKVIYSESALTDCSSGTEATDPPPVPAAPGTLQMMRVTGLEPEVSYNFSVCTWDEEDNPDPILGVFATPVSATPVNAAPFIIYDDIDSSFWTYSSGWVAKTKTGPYDDTIHRTSTFGATATSVFQAPAQFIFYYRADPSCGSFKIFVDGVKLADISACSSTTVWQKKYVSPVYTDDNVHTIVILNTSPTGTTMDVDAIEIH